jgi:hypothetical protein
LCEGTRQRLIAPIFVPSDHGRHDLTVFADARTIACNCSRQTKMRRRISACAAFVRYTPWLIFDAARGLIFIMCSARARFLSALFQASGVFARPRLTGSGSSCMLSSTSPHCT